MWMLIRNLLLAGMVVFWVTPAFCEYYQYTDQNGVLRFTDDFASVPPNQRPDVKTHQSVESQPVQNSTGGAFKEKARRSAAAAGKEIEPSGGTWQGRNSQKKQELNQMQADLKKTFEALQAERSAIEAKAPQLGATFEEKLAYTEKVEALNAKIANYEGQLDAYNEKVNAYNSQVKK
jgi:chromosome segregation ATPase